MSFSIREWINGYVKISICGKEKERFINLAKNNGIEIFKLYKDKNLYYGYVRLEQYRKIRKIVRKTHIIPKLRDRCGLPFMYRKYKSKLSLILGIVLGIMIFYIASLYVWNIKIEGENYYTDSEIIR